MSSKDKKVKELLAKLKKEKDSATSGARAIRRKLRELDYYMSKQNKGKAAPEKKSKKAKKEKSSQKRRKLAKPEEEEEE